MSICQGKCQTYRQDDDVTTESEEELKQKVTGRHKIEPTVKISHVELFVSGTDRGIEGALSVCQPLVKKNRKSDSQKQTNRH